MGFTFPTCAAAMDASAMVPLVHAKKLAPWLLPPHLAALAAPPAGANEPAKPQITCVELKLGFRG